MSDNRLPMAKHDRLQGGVEIRGIDARMQASQTAIGGKPAYTAGNGRLGFVDDDQLGERVRI